jgi:circadian clock protein KaiC
MRIKTYIEGFDERTGGGIPVGHVVLVAGCSGSMKSSFVFSILYHAALHDNLNGLYITLEQSGESMIRNMISAGIVRGGEEILEKKLVVSDIPTLRRGLGERGGTDMMWFDVLLNLIKFHKGSGELHLCAIDSLDVLYALTRLKEPRQELFHFVQTLKDLKITTFMISEMDRDSQRFAKYGFESFLSDAIIHLDLRRVGDAIVNLYLSIVKMREVKHDRTYYHLLFKDGRFSVAPMHD